MNTKIYYSDKRAKEKDLGTRYPEGYVLVFSLENRLLGSTGGSISEVDLDNAARVILAGTHREASPEEARLYRQEQELRRAQTSGDPLESARRQFGLLKKGGS